MMKEVKTLLDVKDLQVSFPSLYTHQVIKGVSFSIKEGETLALVGESGSGKTVTALSVMGLIDEPGRITGGSIRFNGQDILGLDDEGVRQIRGRDISMVFQEPMTAMNPVMTVGSQIREVIEAHKGKIKKNKARKMVIDLLRKVDLHDPDIVYHQYPHVLSGGMRQRAMIAMAIALEPKLIILDEPTTALDVTIQAQILELITRLKEDMGISFLFITHNFAIVNQIADYVAVMYAGKIVECGLLKEIFSSPVHPYTKGLLNCIPCINDKRNRLAYIPGNIPGVLGEIKGCPFVLRCNESYGQCECEVPQENYVCGRHFVACWKSLQVKI